MYMHTNLYNDTPLHIHNGLPNLIVQALLYAIICCHLGASASDFWFPTFPTAHGLRKLKTTLKIAYNKQYKLETRI
jgi:hypothetical protein